NNGPIIAEPPSTSPFSHQHCQRSKPRFLKAPQAFGAERPAAVRAGYMDHRPTCQTLYQSFFEAFYFTISDRIWKTTKLS
ncbi:hypothetical protein, partial [Iodidimonas muriae]|uniref:hypothetical protein n=1 Tax=Iodidimonas muriae TaxID=261467 RepID=UPI001E4FED22